MHELISLNHQNNIEKYLQYIYTANVRYNKNVNMDTIKKLYSTYITINRVINKQDYSNFNRINNLIHKYFNNCKHAHEYARKSRPQALFDYQFNTNRKLVDILNKIDSFISYHQRIFDTLSYKELKEIYVNLPLREISDLIKYLYLNVYLLPD